MSKYISAVIVYYEKYDYDNVNELYSNYKNALETINNEYELIYVIDGHLPNVTDELKKIKENDSNVKISQLGRWFGDATALQAGFEHSSGENIIILPSYQQVDAAEIPKMIEALKENDMVVGRRFPRIDSFLNSIQSKIFNSLIKLTVGVKFNDMKCQVRAFKRDVLDKIYLYGNQDRFLPLWAWRVGYSVKELNVKQFKRDKRQAVYPLGNYVSRFLEIISLFFLIRFTKKPIRFFGSSGLIMFFVGSVIGAYLFIERVFMGVPLADRPVVLVSLLFLIFGIISFAIGLIGELIIFTHAKDLKDFIIQDVFESKEKVEQINEKTK